MANVISLRTGLANPTHDGVSRIGKGTRTARRLLQAVAAVLRQERTLRELRRMSDRQLRDIGLERADVGSPAQASTGWDATTLTWPRPGGARG